MQTDLAEFARATTLAESVRRDLPRKTEFSNYSDQDLHDIIWAINTTPRKCHGFLTPAEAFLHQFRYCT